MAQGDVAARLRAAALALPGAWEDSPWDGDTVAKVGDKIFVFLGDGVDRGQERPQPHRGRRVAAPVPRRRVGHGLHRPARLEHPAHDGAIDEDELLEAIETSYEIVVSGLPRSAPRHRLTRR